jgi:hypothetical protein
MSSGAQRHRHTLKQLHVPLSLAYAHAHAHTHTHTHTRMQTEIPTINMFISRKMHLIPIIQSKMNIQLT